MPTPSRKGPEMKLPTASAYREDRMILKALGLEVFKDVPHGQEHYLGTIHRESNMAIIDVDIYVTGMPAQFYRFDVTLVSKESNLKTSKFSVSTGSGNFRAFWKILDPLLEQMSQGMMTITPE
jgi:hypothetical protein